MEDYASISSTDAGILRNDALQFALMIAREDSDNTYEVDAILKMADPIYKFLYDGELPRS